MWRGTARTSGWRWATQALLLALSGCAHIPGFHRTLLADQKPAGQPSDLSSRYVVHCPDVLSFEIAGRPGWCGERAIASDGRVWLDADTSVRVDGLTVQDVATTAAHRLGLATERVRAEVASYNSQHVYFFGEAEGLKRAVAYRGPEPLLDVLQCRRRHRPGAAPRSVRVVRSHVADDKKPETFEVDLEAIVVRHEQQSNITVEPFDKIYIAQTRQLKLSKCLPPWMRALYNSLWDLHKQPERAAE